MGQRATRYQRIIKDAGTNRVVNIGAGGRQVCTTLHDTVAEARLAAHEWVGKNRGSFARGSGMQYIIDNRVDLYYYLNGKLVKTLREK